MGHYPFNTNLARTAQTDVDHVQTDLKSIVHYGLSTPAAADVDYYAAAQDMLVGAYTLNASLSCPEGARNVTVTHADTVATDTLGTIVIVGTDLADESISETITPVANSTVQGTKAFKTIVSVTGAGWVVSAGVDKDHVSIGFGDLIGLPDKLTHNTVLAAVLNNVREATAPTVAVSATVLASNTVDLNSALGGTPVDIYYIP